MDRGWSLELRGLEHVAMNHGVGGLSLSSPLPFQKGKDLSRGRKS